MSLVEITPIELKVLRIVSCLRNANGQILIAGPTTFLGTVGPELPNGDPGGVTGRAIAAMGTKDQVSRSAEPGSGQCIVDHLTSVDGGVNHEIASCPVRVITTPVFDGLQNANGGLGHVVSNYA